MSTRTGHNEGTVIPFPRRRGRPKLHRPKCDTGTPELIMRRLKGETLEALDLCLERGIITSEQHWCGIHLRWLYTLRYGAPGIRTLDPTHLGGIDHKPDDPEWRGAREKEYNEAIMKLSQEGCLTVLSSLCIYNERPDFLKHPKKLSARRAREISASIARIQTGLELLVKYWRR